MIGMNMVGERKGLWGQAQWNDMVLPGPWSMQPGLVGEQAKLFAAAGALVQWETSWRQEVQQPLRWWRLDFVRPQTESPCIVDLASMQKGIVWLNGHALGRYWLTPAVGELEIWHVGTIIPQGQGEPTQRYYHLPTEWLQENNTLVLFEELGGDPGGIVIHSVIEG